jgi:hypothetical protein
MQLDHTILWISGHQHITRHLLNSAPVVKSPKYDGSHFIITTNRCKDGFAGMLSNLLAGWTKREILTTEFTLLLSHPNEHLMWKHNINPTLLNLLC